MPETSFIYFADLMGKPVYDKAGAVVGRFRDLIINPQDAYPPVTGIVLARGRLNKTFAEVNAKDLLLAEGRIQVNVSGSDLTFSKDLNNDVFRIRKDILDQQVVDIHNHKVIRVNDVHLLHVAPLRVVHVDIGTRGLLRRLGWLSWIDGLLKLVRLKARYLNNEVLVSWKYVKTITLDPSDPIHMDLTAKQLEKIPPADLGEIVVDLDIHQRIALFRTADKHHRARLFERLDFAQQEQLLENLDTREAVELLSEMSADEAVDLLGEMPPDQAKQLLSLMESSQAKKLSLLLGYEEDEAGGMMTTEFLEIPKNISVAEAIALIKEKTPEVETIYYLYITNESKQLIGTTTLRRLIAADPTTSVEQTIFPKPVYVYLNTPMKEVAFLMDKYKVSALPVINKEKHLQGIITVDDILHHVIPIAWRRRAGKKHAGN
jgi:magnesium transporter